MINEVTIILALAGIISIAINVLLVVYLRQVLLKVVTASESASQIFTRLDAFNEHLSMVHEKPLFYGDETLQGLMEHAKSLYEFLSIYEDVYSFTQPDLRNQLELASQDYMKENEKEEEG